ncbi:hypothetical protein N864_21185 [Intrasporangium chromatireducens Q5-1]|uniref:Phosphatidylglycerol lysyltransferase C-terminal domain-containing protein n=1 Tax=Intrasporangium chromatireducens Q5-1 TaxID=584657 RepID=W9GJM6_9MICO|nr:DUF2156 domain-containing protein [Intrasporangium chromatireducens]EWT06456.1 hypothetical protein N864_21185 [Intrasporangium chromatireducens Q5-1]
MPRTPSASAALDRLTAAVRSLPLTITAVATVTAIGLVTGALTSSITADRLSDTLGYGLPAFEDGRWWTLLSGALLAVSPWGYLPVLVALAVLGAIAERRLGTRPTLVAMVICHVGGVVGAAAFIALADAVGWERFARLADLTDAGPSAGFVGAVTVATAAFTPRWRFRWRLGLLGYVAASVVLLSGIADVEHALAVLIGLGLGPVLRRHHPGPTQWLSSGRPDPGRRPDEWDERAAATTLLRQHGSTSRLGWMTTWRGNEWFRPAHLPGYVAHRRHAGVALALGDPVGRSPQERAQLLDAYAADCTRRGLVPCVFAAGEETRLAARRLGWKAIRIADEAVIELDRLCFRGKAWQDVRTALNHAGRDGITFRLCRLGDEPGEVRSQVEAISRAWVAGKALPELGFTLGGLEEALDPSVRVGIAIDRSGRVHGFTSWLPVHRAGDGELTGWTLDVMRRGPQAFRGVMEFLVASACLAFRAEGAQTVSLSASPLAHCGGGACGRLDAWLDRLGSALEPCYGFRSLHAFKSKFQPRYEPLHLLYPSALALPRIGAALTAAYLPGVGLGELTRLARNGHAEAKLVERHTSSLAAA